MLYTSYTQIETIEIGETPALLERYRTRIPVVALAGTDGRRLELNWPFDCDDCDDFVNCWKKYGPQT